MTCKVKGGKPLVSSVDFYCRGHPDTEPDEETLTGVQAVVTIPRLTSAHHGMTCVCSAEWKVPEMYTHKAYVTLTVVTGDVGSKDVGRKNELWTVVGIVVEVFIIVGVVIVAKAYDWIVQYNTALRDSGGMRVGRPGGEGGQSVFARDKVVYRIRFTSDWVSVIA